jgi:hypothetical protein
MCLAVMHAREHRDVDAARVVEPWRRENSSATGSVVPQWTAASRERGRDVRATSGRRCFPAL